MYNPEAPFGLEPLGLELGAERLMAERKRRGHLLNRSTIAICLNRLFSLKISPSVLSVQR